ncbi:sulfotransferase domain-containing protein [Marivirga sp. S37H4]|uniref:Sulfotransferase domain-containing protein n=1 Tax=Marivirga aurantiaca TaxID=2802615 RepID=A0A934WZ89_9BACT|nr:sulfotransferase domain-containing protein [Marivirga aurantiaca]MBK6265582.1 sulfotransferase domain-containing protein [Marivirga aurantiaca]
MSILQGGVPKCGNFWLYQIIQQILTRSGRSTTSYIEQQPIYKLAKEWDLNFPDQARIDVLQITDLQVSYRISSIFKMPVENLQDYVRQAPHVWTHSPVCKKSGEVLDQFDKKIYIIRDPRDRAISASEYYCSPYMLKYFPQEETDPEKYLQKNFSKLMHDWVWHVYDHLRLSKEFNIHITYFEMFLHDFSQELNHLLDYLNIELNQNEKEAIEKAVSFAKLKEENPQHLKKGTSGYWKEILTEEQKEESEIIAGPLLRYLNYNIDGKQLMNTGTIPAHDDFELLKEELILSQEQLYHS